MAKIWNRIKGFAGAVGLSMALLAGVGAADQARAQDPSFLNFSFGRYDFNRQKADTWEGGVQYRSDQKLWIFQPIAGAMVNGNKSANVYAGVSLDIFFGNRWVLRPSFAPGLYFRGSDGEDLGYPLEFRSALELAYRFDDRSRLGLEIYHLSNAHLDKHQNPGEESINLVYSIPTSKIFGK